ncbi:MAG: TolC family protein [Bacteroidales bacterium]|nr:TolC family protein [Bacteroidales bacterium]MCF8334558.1 TolC family protein [Bacteroidales bacterium]
MKIHSKGFGISKFYHFGTTSFRDVMKYSWALLILSLFLLAGCAPQTKISELPAEHAPSFSASGTEAMTDRWWQSFDDDKLNKLVDSALANNFDLRTAWQRLKAAEASARSESASLFPWLEASAQGRSSRFGGNTVLRDNLSLDASASYEVDLWGRIRSQVEAERFRAEATRWDYKTAALSLSAEISRAWFQLLETRNQLELINHQIETNQKTLRLLKARFGSGQIRSVDILRQKQLLESTHEQKASLQASAEVLENRLAVLTGQPPQEAFNYQGDSLPDMPPLPETGLPAELLRRRPDVQSAFNALKAADKDVASAISNRYPRLSLSASLSSTASSSNVEDILSGWVSSFGGNLFAPLFYAGQRKAEVDRAEAVKKQRLYQYGQAVLTAYREVEDALAQERKQREKIESIQNQLELAQQSYEQLRLEYFNGMSDYLDVLTALDEEQRLQRDLLSARMTLLEYRIALYRALAGGFETEREESER